MCIFFFSMTWLETFSAAEAYAEVKTKFLPTYCMAITIWPVIGVRDCGDEGFDFDQRILKTRNGSKMIGMLRSYDQK